MALLRRSRHWWPRRTKEDSRQEAFQWRENHNKQTNKHKTKQTTTSNEEDVNKGELSYIAGGTAKQ